MDNKEEKPKTEKKGKYVVKDGEGNIISQNMPKEFEDMIDLIFQEAKEKSNPAGPIAAVVIVAAAGAGIGIAAKKKKAGK